MAVSYDKLWKKVQDNGMKKMDLLNAIKMGPSTLSKLSKNQDVSMDVLKRICEYFSCDIGDIVEIVHDEREGER